MVYACKVCDKQFNNQRDLDRHNNRKNPCKSANICKICNSRFNKPYLLKRHMNIHVSDVPDNCIIRNGIIRSIKNIKVAENIYKCSKCDLKFNIKSSHMRHERKCVVLLTKGLPPSSSKDKFEEDGYHVIHDFEESEESNCRISNEPSVIASTVESISLKPIHNIRKDYIEIKNIKDIMNKEGVSMILTLANLFYGNVNIKENHVIYAIDNRCYMYDGARWNKRRTSNKFLVEFMNYIFHAAESIILKVDVMGDSNIYNELVKRRNPTYLKYYAKDYRCEFINLLTGFKFSKVAHDKWISSQPKKTSIGSSTKQMNDAKKMNDTKKTDDTEYKSFSPINLNISPYNSDDDEYYNKSMQIFKEQNKLLCLDGTIIDIPKNYQTDNDSD